MSMISGMYRIRVSPAAYLALRRPRAAKGSPKPQGAAQGAFFVWLDKDTLNKLEAFRRPSEGFSAAILRLAKLERRI